MKTDFPLFIVGIDQGIPSKFEEYTFKIHSNILKLESNKDIKEGTQILLTFSTKENISLEKTDFQKEINYTGPIGIKSKCISINSTDDNEIFEIKTSYIEEVYLKEIVSNSKSLTATPFKNEINIDVEKNSIHETMSFIIFLGKKTEILKKEDLKVFKQTKSIIDLCDSIVHFYYTDNFEKYVYLQIQDLSEKIKNVVNFLLDEGNIELTPEIKLFTKFDFKKQETASSDKTLDKYPQEVKEVLQKEAKKLSRTPSSSLEAQSIQTYIETIQNIPWGQYSSYSHSIKEVIQKIDETHYGLEDVKKHIFQHMVLEDHIGESRGTVLCFLGPPGTGKTSIVKSIAKATDREVVKIALGGVSDEAEIRGHRRTYVASKPGRLVEGLIKTKQMNPIILLDEVDKMDKGTRGDPTSALLELLDPEQNNEFIDRFVEIPMDLSKCLFICTANYESGIPEALRDRFEFIHFENYEEHERQEILKEYIISKVIKDYKMDDFNIEVKDSFYKEISKTVSLREIEKKTRKIFKAVLVEFVIDEIQKATLDENSITYLNKTKPTTKIGFANVSKNLSK